MINYYIDSSVLVSMLLQEDQEKRFMTLFEASQGLYSSQLLEAEVYSVAAREDIPPDKASEFIELVSLIIPQRSLRSEFHKIFQAGYCRGPDAYHIAAALYLDPKKQNLTFVSADMTQNQLASKIGFRIF